ncbi:response regulator [Aestuariibacter sp. A3R04]|uniref:response regulator n=1 Tax=Aestuariibacter sp. A3R04 TaxID=2841571 RepID=UPI001C09127C|nr:response regulator [Aestuariibacter sp. A3R04]MBU3021423.1 response regulator [Aestuariibacter sp. A3R04]
MAAYNIAVVDDDTLTLDIVTYALEDAMEVNVYGFSRSEMAREFLRSPSGRQLSLIISDQNMPQYDGLTLLKDCRAAGVNVPFILLTADATRETVIAAKKGGATQFLAKPFSTDDLIAKVKALLV